jgi:hypothetical protein
VTETTGIPVSLPATGVLGLTGDGAIRVLDDGVEIKAGQLSATLSIGAILGADYRDGALELFTRHGRFVLRGGAALASVQRALVSQAGALPGVTRALRALGSKRGRPGADHDRFFAPLLAARRRAERAADPAVRLAAFDGTALRRAIEAAVLELAEMRYPGQPSARRAAEEELLELAEPVLVASDSLVTAAQAVRDAEPDEIVQRWREWTAAVKRAFESADRCWMRIARELDQPVRPRRPLWKRFFAR